MKSLDWSIMIVNWLNLIRMVVELYTQSAGVLCKCHTARPVTSLYGQVE